MKNKIGIILILCISILSCNNQLHKQSDLELLKKYCTLSNDTLYTDTESIWKVFPDSVFDNKLVIACGQSSHGSHENFEIQASIFKNLVEKKGVRIFIIEGVYSEILGINDYISEGIGNKESVLPKMGLKIWVTEEMWQLIEWMKEFNSKRPNSDKILILGNSVNDPDATIKVVSDFFSKYCPQNNLEAKKLLQSFEKDSVLKNIHKHVNVAIHLHENIAKLNKLVENADTLISSENKIDYLLSKRNITMLEECLWTLNNSINRFDNIGDSIMATNIKWVVDNKFRSGPVFVWAHNYHIATQPLTNHFAKRMGTFLQDFFGDKYYTIGIDFISGEINSQTQIIKEDSAIIIEKSLKINEPDSNYLNYYISKLNASVVLFNMEVAKRDTLFLHNKIYKEANRIHDFPVAGGDDPQNIRVREFNIILFFKHSIPTQMIYRSNITKH